MAYPYKKRNTWYVGFVNEHGQPDQMATKARTKKEAQDLAWEKEKECERRRLGLDTGPKRLLFGALTADYLDALPPEKRSKDTIEQRVRDYILPEFKDTFAHEILAAHVDGFLNRRATGGRCPECKEKRCQGEPRKAGPFKKGSVACVCKCHQTLSPQMREHLRHHLQAIFTFGIVKLKALRDNPAADATEVPIYAKPPRVLPDADRTIPFLLRCVSDEYRGMVAVALLAALRKGEVLGLQVADIDLARRIIRIWRSYDNDTTKGGGPRPVPILDELVPFLEVELGRSRSKWLFPDEKGHMRTSYTDLALQTQKALIRAELVEGYDHVCAKCENPERHADSAQRYCRHCTWPLEATPVELDFSFKDLRSTWATIAYERTGDLHFVQSVLGHSNIEVTRKRYAKMRGEHLAATAADLKMSGGAKVKLTYPVLTGTDSHAGQGVRAPEEIAMIPTTYSSEEYGVRTRDLRRDRPAETLGGRGRALHVVGSVDGLSDAITAVVGPSGSASVGVSYPVLTGPWVTIPQAAQYLGASERWVYRLMKEGTLKAEKAKGRTWISTDSLRAVRP